MYRSTTSIDDIFRLAFPAGAQLLTGEEYLARSVSWACCLRPSPPAFPKLDGSELALIDMDDLRRLDAQMRLDRVVHSLQSARVSAIAVLGTVEPSAVRAAQATQLPLFQLPASESLVQVERAVIRLIVDRAGYVAQRSAELQRELNQIALEGGGPARIAEYVQQFAQQPVLLLREDGSVLTFAGLEHLPEARRESLLEHLPHVRELRTSIAQQNGSSGRGVLVRLENLASADYCQAVALPVVANEQVRGFCLLLRSALQGATDISAVEEIASSQCAAAAALEWAKQHAVDVAADSMRAAFVDELLATNIADEQAWIQRGASLGFDVARPHVAWLVEARGIPEWPAPLLRFVGERHAHVPFSRRQEGILLFWPTDNPKSGRDHKEVAAEMVARFQSQFPRSRLLIGIGRPAVGPAQWLQSQQQARESWRLGKAWKGAPVTYFGDLGLYQLLTALGVNPEAARFYRKTMGKLVAFDKEKNAELVETLDAFFACHGNLSQTAARLHIHRNTLTYRLGQIANVAQVDLEDPDARFSLQLALKLRPVLRNP